MKPGHVAIVAQKGTEGGSFLRAMLESVETYAVSEAEFGAGEPDLRTTVALVDVGRDPVRAADEIRRLRRAVSGISVVVIAASDDHELVKAVFRAGADDLLVKGDLNPGLLARVIRHSRLRQTRTGAERGGSRTDALTRTDLSLGEPGELPAEVSALLASTLDYGETVRRFASALIPRIADWCVVNVVGESTESERIEVAAADPGKERLLRTLGGRLPGGRGGADNFVDRATRTRTPIVVPRIREEDLDALGSDDRTRQTLRALAPRSIAVIPLLSHGRGFGTLTCVLAESGRSYRSEDLDLLQRLGRIAAREVENASLYRSANEAIQVRDEILGVVAHDLRSPLGAISILSSLLLRDGSGGSEDRVRIETIQDAAEQMDHLIQDLLDITRIEERRLRIDAEPVHLSELVEEALSLLAGKATQRGVALQGEVMTGLPWVHADSRRIRQVLSNLLTNAVKFTPSGGSVKVRAESRGEEVRVSVIDTGCGIEPEYLPHVFDRYWQKPGSSHDGIGLGLTISLGLVQAHGGRIWAESEPGRGSVFTFTLPVEPAPVLPDDEPTGERLARRQLSGRRPGRPLRILLVDDHPMILNGLREVLRAVDGVEVVGQASTGEEAIVRARESRPDIVLMDLSMPGAGGVAATRAIAAMEGNPQVIALTADTEEESLVAVLEAGGTGFIRKASAFEDLVPALEAAARGEVFLRPGSNRVLVRGLREAASEKRTAPIRMLGDRERQILALTAEGYTSAEIGKRIYLSRHTVNTYRKQIMDKLGVRHRSELVRIAVQAGLLDDQVITKGQGFDPAERAAGKP